MPAEPTQGYRLLVACSAKDEAQVIHKYFSDCALTVDVAADGEAALLSFVHSPPDAILMDVTLAKLDGPELARRVKGHLMRGKTPLFVMADRLSSGAEEEELRARLTADAVFRKPLPLKEVLQRMDDLVMTTWGKSRPAVRPPSSASMPAVKAPGAITSSKLQAVKPPAFGKPITLSSSTARPPPEAFGKPTTQSSSTARPATPAFGRPTTQSTSSARPPPDTFGKPITQSTSTARPPSDTFGKPTTQSSSPERAATPAFGKPATQSSPSQKPAPWSFASGNAPSSSKEAGLSGVITPPAIAQAVLQIFEQRLDGVLDVKTGAGQRTLFFQDGLLVDARSTEPQDAVGAQTFATKVDLQDVALDDGISLRMWDDDVVVGGVGRMHVLMHIERHVRKVAVRSLASQGAAFSFRWWTGNPILGSLVLLDPVELLQEMCLQVKSAQLASSFMESGRAQSVLTGEAFNARVMVFSRLSPQSMVPAVLLDSPRLSDAMQRAVDSGPKGMSELLALVLSRAVELGTAGKTALTSKRPSSQLPPSGEWSTPATPMGRWLRHEVAHEWIRSVGREPHEILKLKPEPVIADVRAALIKHRARFGPQALDDQELGPARMFLEVVRRRREEAVRVLQAPR